MLFLYDDICYKSGSSHRYQRGHPKWKEVMNALQRSGIDFMFLTLFIGSVSVKKHLRHPKSSSNLQKPLLLHVIQIVSLIKHQHWFMVCFIRFSYDRPIKNYRGTCHFSNGEYKRPFHSHLMYSFDYLTLFIIYSKH